MNMILSPEKMQKIIDELKGQIAIKDQQLEAKGGLPNTQMRRISKDISSDAYLIRKKEVDLLKKIED
jgi:hypothetical protein